MSDIAKQLAEAVRPFADLNLIPNWARTSNQFPLQVYPSDIEAMVEALAAYEAAQQAPSTMNTSSGRATRLPR